MKKSALTKMTCSALGVFCAVLLYCGGPVPDLIPRISESPSIPNLIDRSPVIVVGKVNSVTPLGDTFHIGKRFAVRLQRVELLPEHFLRGRSPRESATFYQYAWAGEHILDWAMDVVRPGSRRIFFLDQDGDLLRATVDLGSSHLTIPAGHHGAGELGVGELPVRETIARLLLKPAADFDARSFAGSLPTGTYQAERIVGAARVSELLRALVNHSDPELSARACLALAGQFFGQSDCLEKLLQRPGLTDEVRRTARRTLETSVRRDTGLVDLLTENPKRWFAAEWSRATSREHLREHLRALAMHSDPRVARIVCGLLNDAYPMLSEPRCSAHPIGRKKEAQTSYGLEFD